MRLRSCLVLLAMIPLLNGCGGDKKMEVLAPDAAVAGQGAQELLQQFITNVAEVPLEDNMFNDPNNCDMGRSTSAIYFGPAWSAPGPRTASCTMQASQTLFLSPVGVFCSDVLPEEPTIECLDGFWEVAESSVTIDGELVANMEDRVVEFAPVVMNLPDGDIFQLGVPSTEIIARGYVVLVQGLPVGEHSVVLSGAFDSGFAGTLTIDLTVET